MLIGDLIVGNLKWVEMPHGLLNVSKASGRVTSLEKVTSRIEMSTNLQRVQVDRSREMMRDDCCLRALHYSRRVQVRAKQAVL